MIHNKDSAIECFELAYASFKGGDTEKTVRLLHKCKRMYPELNPSNFSSNCHLFSRYNSLDSLIENINTLYHHQQQQQQQANSNGDSSSGSTSSTRRRRSNSKRETTTSTPTEEPELKEGIDYTKEQAAEVKRVMSCQNDYYKVLDLEKGADEAAIKKSYKKMAVKLHPDRNKAPHATEAFKVVSAAYVCLSDPDKRKLFDQYGTEDIHKINEQRNPFAGMRGGHGSPFMFRSNMGGARQFQMDDEELFFNLFSQMFGGPGMSHMQAQRRRHFHSTQQQHHQHQRHHRRQQEGSGINLQACFQFVLVLFIILGSFNFSLFSSSDSGVSQSDRLRASFYNSSVKNSDAIFAFTKVDAYTVPQVAKTHHGDIRYFVAKDFERQYRGYKRNVDTLVVQSYKVYLEDHCKIEEAKVRTDIERAEKMKDQTERAKVIETAKKREKRFCNRLELMYG